jgi:3-dehydroquinate dehydratase-2
MADAILILNGPNLNLLGRREPEIYGTETLAEIEQACTAHAEGLGLSIEFRQTNSETELVEWVQDTRGKFAALIINAGAYTHTSIALHDALMFCDMPVIEVHLSNIFQREPFRHKSYVSPIAKGVICGFGGQGYLLALDAAARVVGAK